MHEGDGDGGVAQRDGHTPNNGLTEICRLGLLCTSLYMAAEAAVHGAVKN